MYHKKNESSVTTRKQMKLKSAQINNKQERKTLNTRIENFQTETHSAEQKPRKENI
jgi:hypothetical protein